MRKYNKTSFFTIVLIVLYVQEVQSEVWDGLLETNKIASRDGFTRNSGFHTAAAEEKFDDDELRKLFVRNFKLYEKLLKEKEKHTVDKFAKTHSRKTRNINNMSATDPLECYVCNSTKTENLECYGSATSFPTIKCAGIGVCFTELHPKYIRRGCANPDKVNRTFVCKCPLCNDKPSYNHSYFSYRTESEWEYGNSVIMEEGGAELLCKFCKTKGVNASADAICREGKKTKMKRCNENEICYTNIDDQSDIVSRGCIKRPVYNSLYSFCGVTLCNHQSHTRPEKRFDRDTIMNLFLTNVNTSQLKYPLKNEVAHKIRHNVFAVFLLLFHDF